MTRYVSPFETISWPRKYQLASRKQMSEDDKLKLHRAIPEQEREDIFKDFSQQLGEHAAKYYESNQAMKRYAGMLPSTLIDKPSLDRLRFFYAHQNVIHFNAEEIYPEKPKNAVALVHTFGKEDKHEYRYPGELPIFQTTLPFDQDVITFLGVTPMVPFQLCRHQGRTERWLTNSVWWNLKKIQEWRTLHSGLTRNLHTLKFGMPYVYLRNQLNDYTGWSSEERSTAAKVLGRMLTLAKSRGVLEKEQLYNVTFHVNFFMEDKPYFYGCLTSSVHTEHNAFGFFFTGTSASKLNIVDSFNYRSN